jgi:serine/threonine protein phosphatase PrpC
MKDPAWEYSGASVKGPLHRADNMPNQDAWFGRHFSFGTVVCAADGMGSRKHADIGARAACRSVADAARQWARSPQCAPAVLLQFIHIFWRLHIEPLEEKDCCATCLFAIALKSGRLIVGQLGDGLIATATTSEDCQVLYEPKEGFGNQTIGLGLAKSMQDWRWSEFNSGSRVPDKILICTDGISDDLKPGKHLQFITWLSGKLKSGTTQMRWRKIAHELRNWPTPYHSDDKTLVLLQRTPGKG